VVVADDQRAVRDGLAVLVGLPDNLTPREVEVLTLIGAGLSNREIGERLVLGQATVKTHVNRIFAKIGVRSRAQAVRYAISNGLTGPTNTGPGRGAPAR
jgi:DNA-binding NarL/FixJ family response regulator